MTNSEPFAKVESQKLIAEILRQVVVGQCILPLPNLPEVLVSHWELSCKAINAAHEAAVKRAVDEALSGVHIELSNICASVGGEHFSIPIEPPTEPEAKSE